MPSRIAQFSHIIVPRILMYKQSSAPHLDNPAAKLVARVKRCVKPSAPKPLKGRSDPGSSGKFLHHQPTIQAPSLRKVFEFRWQRRRRKSRGKTRTLHPSSSNQRSCLRKDGNAYARKPRHGRVMVVNSSDATTQPHAFHGGYCNRVPTSRHSETKDRPWL